jgi:multisubunit Na+/H+ antiporter MnhB subunit
MSWNIYFILFMIFAAAIVLTLLSYTPWARENMKWLTSFKAYLVIGLLIGGCLAAAGLLLSQSMATLYTPDITTGD